MIPVQDEVDGGSSGTFVSSQPLFQGVSPVAPEFRHVRGDLKPMVTDEEEVVGAFSEPTKWRETTLRSDVPTKDGSKDFGGCDDGYVQQRVSSPLELGYIPSAFFDSLLQIADAVYVDFVAHTVQHRSASAATGRLVMASLTSKTTHYRDSGRLVSGHCESEAAETYLGQNRGYAMGMAG